MKKLKKKIKIIDLFAGPGGLGEGFSSCVDDSPFQIAMSVEFEKHAHKTLTLRALYRKLNEQELKNFYYPYIKSTNEIEKDLNFQLLVKNCREKWEAAKHETLGRPHALGNPKKWRKIKTGEVLTAKDTEPTTDEKEIMQRIDEIKAEHDGPLIVIGGPPCQAYSVNGRNRIRSEKNYSPENDERFFLYEEYLKVLDRADPDLFVMENVEGILTAKLAQGQLIFPKVKQDLVRPNRPRAEQYDIYSFVKAPSIQASEEHHPLYEKDSDYVITASDYGVPQGRKRVILLGIKHKYGPVEQFMKPAFLVPNTVDLLGKMPRLRSGISNKSDGQDTMSNWLKNWSQNREELISILSKRKTAEEVALRTVLNNKNRLKVLAMAGFSKQYVGLTNKYINAFAGARRELEKLKEPANFVPYGEGKGNNLFCNSIHFKKTYSPDFMDKYPELHEWLSRDLGGVPNHVTRGHMKQDLKRYMFSAAWTKSNTDSRNSPFPKSRDYPILLSPEHGNWNSGKHADRFRTIGEETIPHTITSHLRKDGHAQIHYDISQNRSLTVREAARIQTFPDDYYFEGSQGWQYQQVGNAVPAFLAKQIALHVLKLFQSKIKNDFL